MPIILEMPSLSPTMEKGNLVTWTKKEGDEISVGDVIAEIDTDKATMEVESIYKGILEKIIVPAGTHDVNVKTPIAIIRQKNDTDEDIQKALDSLANKDSENNLQNNEKSPIKSVDNAQELCNPEIVPEHNQNFDKIKISPLAKRVANEFGIDISKAIGTGPGGRIVKSDVISLTKMSAAKNVKFDPNQPKYVDEPISQMRRVIAEKLTKSKQSTPHFYMTASANVTDLLKARKSINDSGMIDTKITVNDMIIKAVALAMRDLPAINVSWNDGTLRRYNNVDVSVAVAVEGGLLTPIIENADVKSLVDISHEIKQLARLAKDGKLLPHQFIGGGITVSNLGMYGIDNFSSIINPPQGSILSIGPAQKRPIYDENDQLIQGNIMNIGYAVDHRVIDGSIAAKFLEIINKYLETPILIMM